MKNLWTFLGACAGLSALASIAPAQTAPCPQGVPPAPLPMICGDSAVTHMSGFTGFSTLDQNGFVVTMLRTNNPVANSSGTNSNWCANRTHNETGPASDQWRAANLGQVFGITLDDASPPNIYVAATTSYGSMDPVYASSGAPFVVAFTNTEVGPSGPGAIYKLNGTTGAISTFATLPMGTTTVGSGPGLGNICFDVGLRRFYVSNFDDGRIYCLSATGATLGTLGNIGSPGIITPGPVVLPDPLVDGRFAVLGERPWAVQVYNGRLYYSVWVEDAQRRNPSRGNEVWSIGIGGPSGFSGPAQLEFTLPTMPDAYYSSPYFPPGIPSSHPISDIAFDDNGKMMVAERIMWADVGLGGHLSASNGHQSRNLEYALVGTSWTQTISPTRQFNIGALAAAGINSSGGVDFDCDEMLYSTGDALFNNASGTALVYGLQITPAGGNAPNTPANIMNTCYFVDFNNTYTTADKNRNGDVAVRRDCCRCGYVTDGRILCHGPDQPGAPNATFTYTFTVTNNSGVPVRFLTFSPIAAFTPPSIDLVALGYSPIPVGGTSPPLTVTFTDPTPGDGQFCYRLTLMSETGDICCRIEHCVDLPDCDCMQLPICESIQDPGQLKRTLNFNVQNLGPVPFNELYLFLDPPLPGVTLTPSAFAFSPSIAPGATTSMLNVSVTPISPGQTFTIRFSVHLNGEFCCAETKEFRGSVPVVGGCDPIDFNNDGLYPDTLDIDDFLSVFSGGPCSNDPNCNDIDFNNDGLFPDTADIDAFLSVFSGGPC